METSTAILFIVLSTISISYAWGMRGTTIGGEKGAMLPGAVMGLLIAFFSGSEILRDNFFMLSAVGSMSMYFGGSMTYGETLGISMNTKPAENYKKGLIALFIKGFIWFGIFGSFIGIFITASTGEYYSIKDIILIFALMPVFALTGYFLLNKPLNVKKGKFPKIYFSKTRQECWGGLLGILVLLTLFMWLRSDIFSILLMLGSALSGAIGWVIAQAFQVFSKYPMKNGKYFFKNLQKRNMLECWKIMEFTLGAIGGLGVSITIVLLSGRFSDIEAIIAEKGALWSPISNIEMPLLFIWLVLIAIDMLQFLFIPYISRNELQVANKSKKLSKTEYERQLKKVEKAENSKSIKNYKILVEFFERPLYSAFPLALVLLGGKQIALLASFFIVYLVMVQELTFNQYKLFKHKQIIRVVLYSFGILVVVVQLVFSKAPGMLLSMLMYTVFYEITTLMYLIPRKAKKINQNNLSYFDLIKKKYAGVYSVHSYMIACIIVMLITSFLLF